MDLEKNFDRKLNLLLEEEPRLLDFLISCGFTPLKNPVARETMTKLITLRNALGVKNISEEVFLKKWQDYIAISDDGDGFSAVTDEADSPAAHMGAKKRKNARKPPIKIPAKDGGMTLFGDSSNEESMSFGQQEKEGEKDLLFDGVLPCPVKIPLSEFLDDELSKLNLSADSHFVSANLGLAGMLARMREGHLPDVILSAGFELFFSKQWREKYAHLYTAKGLEKQEGLSAAGIDDDDPLGELYILAVVPAVLIVRKEDFPADELPRSWRQISSTDFTAGVAVPEGDLDLFNAVTLTIKGVYGDEAIENLANKASTMLHPAQMTKDSKARTLPSVNVAPLFFASMLRSETLEAIWPDDGAIASPIFLSYKKPAANDETKLEDYKPYIAAKALASQAAGEILSLNGKFPAASVDPELQFPDGKKLLWIGYDYLRNRDADEEIEACRALFGKVDKKGGDAEEGGNAGFAGMI